MLQSVLAISLGAALGAVLRWWLSEWLNAAVAHVALGTLAANLIGGYGIGLAVGVFMHQPDLPPQWRLFIITGLLGGLTTFSTFSAEVVALLQHSRWSWALATVVLHLAGSLVMTVAGLWTVEVLRRT